MLSAWRRLRRSSNIRWVGDRSSLPGDCMDIKEPIVLLVGNNMSGAFRLVEWLQSLGCEYHIAASYQEARTLLETHRFDVVLSETDLSDGNAYRLIASVRESPASLFFCLAVQDSYWWLRSEEHTSELQSLAYLVCRLLLEKKKKSVIFPQVV